MIGNRTGNKNPNYNREETIRRITSLMQEGKTYEDIARIFNEEGMRTAHSLEYRAMLVQSIIGNQLRVKRMREAKENRKQRQQQTMVTIPVEDHEPKRSSKVVAIMGEASEIADVLKGWIS